MKILKNEKIGCLGLGNMGTAIISGLASQLAPQQLYLFDQDKKKLLAAKKYKANLSSSAKSLAQKSTILILAVKPKDIAPVLEEIKSELSNQLIVSLAAGIKINLFQKKLGKHLEIFRIMPNTPALVKEGMTVISPSPKAKPKSLKKIEFIFKQIGQTMILPEKKLDAVTALSGSGPAYVFTLIKAMTTGGQKMGLTSPEALTLAIQTVLGSAKLLQVTKEKPEILRKKVTSPGGTTMEALQVFKKFKLEDIIVEGVKAATKKSKLLGNPPKI